MDQLMRKEVEVIRYMFINVLIFIIFTTWSFFFATPLLYTNIRPLFKQNGVTFQSFDHTSK